MRTPARHLQDLDLATKRYVALRNGLIADQLELLAHLESHSSAQLSVLREISAKLDPLTAQPNRELRSFLIDAVIHARDLAEGPSSTNGRSAADAMQLYAILRDALRMGFGVKLSIPTSFAPGLAYAERTATTDDPSRDGEIERVISPAFIQERDDGPPITLRQARVAVYAFEQPSEGEVARG